MVNMPAILGVFAVAGVAFAATPAVASGNPHNLGSCAVCHPVTPRFGIDTRKDVAFTTSADDPGLCTGCHPPGQHRHPVMVQAGSGPEGARVSRYLAPGSSVGNAGKVVCISCHFIHAADTRSGLLRGLPGSPDPRYFASAAAFCEECHGANLASRSPHNGGEASCVFCHAGWPSKDRKGGLPAGIKDRCEICHRGLKDEHFAKLSPFGKRGECLLCHDQHAAASASPTLLSETYRAAANNSVVIRPHFRRGLCFACHANTDDYTLRDEDVNVVCDRCHASGKILSNIHPLRKVPPSITVPKGWPLANGSLTCLTCHDQGHEDQPRSRFMLHGGPYATPRAVCRNCHTTDLAASRVHQEINEGRSCEMCHKTRPTPGVDTARTVTFLASPDLLCMRCHDQSAGDGQVHHGAVLGREVEDGHLMSGLPLYGGRVICATCHNPHLSESRTFRLRVVPVGSSYCIGCHGS